MSKNATLENAAGIGLALVVALHAPEALAQNFGKSGQLAISGERAFGLFYIKASHQDDSSDSSTQFSFMSQAPTLPLGFGYAALNVYSLPRIGIDYLVTDGLSVGGSIIYASASNTHKEPGGQNVDTSGNAFIINPRVGYAYMFSEVAGIWPRGGITYHYQKVEDENGDSASLDGLAFSVDAPVIISPVEHFAFLIGPAFDIGITGSLKTVARGGPFTISDTNDATLTGFGVYAGIMGWL